MVGNADLQFDASSKQLRQTIFSHWSLEGTVPFYWRTDDSDTDRHVCTLSEITVGISDFKTCVISELASDIVLPRILGWSYVISALWAKARSGVIHYTKQEDSMQPATFEESFCYISNHCQRLGLDPLQDPALAGVLLLNTQNSWQLQVRLAAASSYSIRPGSLDQREIAWWRAVLSSSWTAFITWNDSIFFSPWSIRLEQTWRFVIETPQSPSQNSSSSLESATATANILRKMVSAASLDLSLMMLSAIYTSDFSVDVAATWVQTVRRNWPRDANAAASLGAQMSPGQRWWWMGAALTNLSAAGLRTWALDGMWETNLLLYHWVGASHSNLCDTSFTPRILHIDSHDCISREDELRTVFLLSGIGPMRHLAMLPVCPWKVPGSAAHGTSTLGISRMKAGDELPTISSYVGTVGEIAIGPQQLYVEQRTFATISTPLTYLTKKAIMPLDSEDSDDEYNSSAWASALSWLIMQGGDESVKAGIPEEVWNICGVMRGTFGW